MSVKKIQKKLDDLKSKNKNSNSFNHNKNEDKKIKKKSKISQAKENIKKKMLPDFKADAFYKIKKDYTKQNPFLKKKQKKQKKLDYYQHKKNLNIYLHKAGFNENKEKTILNIIKFLSVTINIVLSYFIIYAGFYRNEALLSIIFTLIVLWTAIFFIINQLIYFIFYIIIDIKIYQRKLAIEDVLGDYLLLVSSNINAGMPIDKALWYSVRPKFGILSKEIEVVCKSMYVGDDLSIALKKFSEKYDSDILKRTINLILEGMNTGGKIADIINKIATDLQNSKLFKKEMAANVTTYIIFISFATIAAAPFLFALSKQLLVVINDIMASITIPNSSVSSMKFSGDSITINDYNIFASLTLAITGSFSAMIISIIRHGNIKQGLNKIPLFVVIMLFLYFISSKFLGMLFGNFI